MIGFDGGLVGEYAAEHLGSIKTVSHALVYYVFKEYHAP
jgi:hypothetical protein